MLGLKLAKVAELLPYDDADEMFHRVVSHWADPTSLVLGAVEPPTAELDYLAALLEDRARWEAAGKAARAKNRAK